MDIDRPIHGPAYTEARFGDFKSARAHAAPQCKVAEDLQDACGARLCIAPWHDEAGLVMGHRVWHAARGYRCHTLTGTDGLRDEHPCRLFFGAEDADRGLSVRSGRIALANEAAEWHSLLETVLTHVPLRPSVHLSFG